MQTMSTRRFEMGLPLFSGMDLGALLAAQDQISKQDFAGLSTFVETLGKAGKLQVVRKLAAIWKATDLELQVAESDPKVMAEMVATAAGLPFAETFKAAMDFQEGLWASLGISVACSETQTTAPKGKGKRPAGSPSAG